VVIGIPLKGNEKKRNKEEECFGWWKSENETELE